MCLVKIQHLDLTQPQKLAHDGRFVQVHIRRPNFHSSTNVGLLNTLPHVQTWSVNTSKWGPNIGEQQYWDGLGTDTNMENVPNSPPKSELLRGGLSKSI